MTRRDPRITLAQIRDAALKATALCREHTLKSLLADWKATAALERFIEVVGGCDLLKAAIRRMRFMEMPLVRSATLVVLCALGTSVSGCYHYATVDVTVLDGAGSPLPGVQVEPFYQEFLEFFPPELSAVRTNMAGVARMQVCYDYKTNYAGLLFNENIEMQYPYDNYLILEQTGGLPLPLPVDVLRQQRDAPFAITVRLISIAEYRAKHR